jgi:hypothetical protein
MNFNYDEKTIIFKKEDDKRFLTMHNTNISVYEHNLVLRIDTNHKVMSELFYQYNNGYPYNLHILSENNLLVLNTVHIERLEYSDQMKLEMNIIFDNKIFYPDAKNYIRREKINILKEKIKNDI